MREQTVLVYNYFQATLDYDLLVALKEGMAIFRTPQELAPWLEKRFKEQVRFSLGKENSVFTKLVLLSDIDFREIARVLMEK